MSKKGIRGEAHWVGDYSVRGSERCRGTRASALGSTGPQVVGSVLMVFWSMLQRPRRIGCPAPRARRGALAAPHAVPLRLAWWFVLSVEQYINQRCDELVEILAV
ncbi:MAG TPA: hypothetical protein VMW58_10140 [Anaerolineae bacterium]|nr:hypothetical protein [Anaerolineae bacterium]